MLLTALELAISERTSDLLIYLQHIRLSDVYQKQYIVLPAEASHAGLTVESCPELLASLELAMFGRTLGDAGAWRSCQDAAIEDAISNAHLIKR